MLEFHFNIATAPTRNTKRWKNSEMSWQDFCRRVEQPIVTGETAAEYKAMTKSDKDRAKDTGGFVGGYLEDGIRKKDKIRSRALLTLDADHVSNADAFLSSVRQQLSDTAWALYSTHSHTPDKPRFRLVIPLGRKVAPDEYEPIGRRIAQRIDIESMDPTTYEASRFMYWPSKSQDGEYVHIVHDGSLLAADAVLGSYENWRDATTWPTAKAETVARQRELKKLGDPREKKNIVGAFCTAYTISEAIAEFLPDVYTPCDVPNRYTYANGSTTGGFIVYDDDLHAYSHHATDPISGQDVNAFDLVRLNRFIERDDDVKEDTPINKRPSFLAMEALANDDDKVKKILLADIASDFDDALLQSENGDGVDDDAFDWLTKLERGGKDGRTIKATAGNFLLILENDPRLKGMAALDDFSHRVLLQHDLPWRKMRKKDGDVWTDADDAQLRNYISTTYRNLTGKALIDDAFTEVTQKAHFHQVIDWWKTLKWDGVKRVGRILIDYLGAEDSEYTEAVTTLFFKAGVARCMVPGIKFDTCLVLTGPQGIGKSTILARMGGAWFNDSIVSMQGKDVIEQLQGSLVVELAEMQATKRAENDQIKAFISRQVDKFRMPYGHRTGEFPRQCIFAATTNEDAFLKDRTGARRFLIVQCSGDAAKPLKDFTKEVAAQCWAELLEIWKEDKSMILSAELQKVAAAIQEEHSEGSEKFGLVQDYLDTLLPYSWDSWDLTTRRQYLRGDMIEPPAGEVVRDKVCAMEIWCELFENNRAAMKNVDAREINSILLQMPGWESKTGGGSRGRLKFKHYGSQRAFVRVSAGKEQSGRVQSALDIGHPIEDLL